MQIGISKQFLLSDYTNEECEEMNKKKVAKVDTFMAAGIDAGYNFNCMLEPDEIIRYYMSLPGEDRVKLGCNP